jgi:N-acetyl-anhydromuramyl-L-alanine amidase AmpD
MRDINGLIIHATATRAAWWLGERTSAKVNEVKRWHMDERGWSDIGYHFLIDRDGTVAKGRPIERTGAHVRGKNTGTIGISLFGGHGGSESDKFADNFTAEQDTALRGLIADLKARFGDVSVTGHNEYAAKACPCFDVASWLASASTPAAPTPAAPVTAAPAAHWLTAFLQSLFGGKA